jgi:hypothetical protein
VCDLVYTTFVSLYKKRSISSLCCLCVSVDQMTDVQEMWYERHATGGHPELMRGSQTLYQAPQPLKTTW